MLISVYLRRIPHANSIVCYLGTTSFTSIIHPHVRLSTGLLPYKLRKCAGPTSSAWASTKNQPQLPTNLQLITPKGTTNSCRFFRSIPKKVQNMSYHQVHRFKKCLGSPKLSRKIRHITNPCNFVNNQGLHGWPRLGLESQWNR